MGLGLGLGLVGEVKVEDGCLIMGVTDERGHRTCRVTMGTEPRRGLVNPQSREVQHRAHVHAIEHVLREAQRPQEARGMLSVHLNACLKECRGETKKKRVGGRFLARERGKE